MEDLIRLFYYYDDMISEYETEPEKQNMFFKLREYVSSIIEGMCWGEFLPLFFNGGGRARAPISKIF